MTTYILSHISACTWNVSHRGLSDADRGRIAGDVDVRSVMCAARAPSYDEASELNWLLGLDGVQDYLVRPGASMYRNSLVRTHVCSSDLPLGSLLPIDLSAQGLEVYVCCPELSYVQVCQLATLRDAIYLGMVACSDFRLEPAARGGVVFRSQECRSTTSQVEIERLLGSLARERGTKRARAALRYVRAHARSPKECALGMLLCLPSSYGGFGLGELSFNERVCVYDGRNGNNEQSYSYRYPDILITPSSGAKRERIVAVDYDPESTHAGYDREISDARRRNELATVGNLTHFTVTSEDILDFDYLETTAERIRGVLGGRVRPALRQGLNSWESRQLLAEARSKRKALWEDLLLRTYEEVTSNVRTA